MDLAEKDDAPEVIVIVGGEVFKLLADGHDAHGLARARGAAHWIIELRGIGGGCGGLLGAFEKPHAKLVPGLALRVEDGWESVTWVEGKRRLDPSDPVKRDLLPEGDVPELFVDGVWRAGGYLVLERRRQRFKNV